MITSLFRKSTPLNYSVVIIGVIFFFFFTKSNTSTSEQFAVAILGLKLGLLADYFCFSFYCQFYCQEKWAEQRQCLHGFILFDFSVVFSFCLTILHSYSLIFSSYWPYAGLISLHSPKAPKRKYLTLRYGFLSQHYFILEHSFYGTDFYLDPFSRRARLPQLVSAVYCLFWHCDGVCFVRADFQQGLDYTSSGTAL
jgi:hypothetical protein